MEPLLLRVRDPQALQRGGWQHWGLAVVGRCGFSEQQRVGHVTGVGYVALIHGAQRDAPQTGQPHRPAWGRVSLCVLAGEGEHWWGRREVWQVPWWQLSSPLVLHLEQFPDWRSWH